ncbi:MAG TPA: ROK family protein [Roseiflexaceae bacterium]|nr:ROK family protein [Roseiflexaceae bacterium]HMP41078.1 ROK family protein [Roseiflexaceae bacterium]
MLLGLDFGGTKLAAGLVQHDGRIIAGRRSATPAGGAAASLATMLAMAHDLITAHGPVEGVGVSFGGPVEADGRTVRLSMHVAGWDNAPLAQQLEEALGVPAAIANDGDAAALAEYRFGAGRGVQHLLYLTLSTGIGGGIIIGGRLHRGEHAWAGEVGHMVLQPHGPPCPCGRNGCLESLASGLSIARDARLRLADPATPSSTLHAQPSHALTAQAVAAAAAAGDRLAHEIWQHAMEWIGIGIASAANLLNPGRVVVGGGLTRAGARLLAPVREAAARRALDPALAIMPAALGDDVGILGGAALLL